MKQFIAIMALVLVGAWSSQAVDLRQAAINEIQRQVEVSTMTEASLMGLNWKVGDQNNYSMDMGFIKGSMSMTVAEITGEGIWLNQDMDLGFAGKQQAKALIDSNTGAVKKLIVNGQEQQIPEQNIELIETKEDHITVPAGSFDCIFARLMDKNQNKEIKTWINPREIPISGMLKTIQPGQFGDVTLLLKSFRRAK